MSLKRSTNTFPGQMSVPSTNKFSNIPSHVLIKEASLASNACIGKCSPSVKLRGNVTLNFNSAPYSANTNWPSVSFQTLSFSELVWVKSWALFTWRGHRRRAPQATPGVVVDPRFWILASSRVTRSKPMYLDILYRQTSRGGFMEGQVCSIVDSVFPSINFPFARWKYAI